MFEPIVGDPCAVEPQKPNACIKRLLKVSVNGRKWPDNARLYGDWVWSAVSAQIRNNADKYIDSNRKVSRPPALV